MKIDVPKICKNCIYWQFEFNDGMNDVGYCRANMSLFSFYGMARFDTSSCGFVPVKYRAIKPKIMIQMF